MRLPARPRARGLLLPLASGLLMGAAFQPWGLWWLAFISLVPLFLALGRLARDPAATWRDGFRAGFVAGFGMFGLMVHWILFLTSHHLPHPAVMVPLFLLMVAYLSLYPALFGVLVLAGARRTGLSLAVLFPLFWVAVEWLRGSGEMGFPWGNAGYALSPHLPFMQGAAWVGIPGLSLLVVAVNVAVGTAVTGRGVLRAAAPGLAGLALVSLHLAGAGRLAAHPVATDPSTTVAVVQPNIDQGVKWDWEHKEGSVAAIARLMSGIEPGSVDLAVWPETSIPSYLRVERGYFRLIRNIVVASRTPTLLGFPDTEVRDEGRVFYNAALYLDGSGEEIGEYMKIHLVPFGETLPFQRYVPFLRGIDFGEADFTPGESVPLFPVGDHRFGVTICFEAIFPEMTREIARQGADLLVNITNDAWYGRSSASWQHAQMARTRSIESGLPQVRSANTGISFVVDPLGRRLAETGTFVEDLVVIPVELGAVPTFYVKHGDLCLRVILAVATVAVGAMLFPVPGLSRRSP